MIGIPQNSSFKGLFYGNDTGIYRKYVIESNKLATVYYFERKRKKLKFHDFKQRFLCFDVLILLKYHHSVSTERRRFILMQKSGKSVKYKKQKLSSEVLTEMLRSDDSEDELVEFINSSFSNNGPSVANNNKKRNRTSAKPKDEESMQEIDLNVGISTAGSTGANVYDLSANGESIILGEKPRSARARLCIAFGLFESFLALGISIAMLGPSLLDLKDQVNSSFQGVSTIFTARSVGYLLGSVVAGWLFDRWNGYLVLAVSCLIASICCIIIPLTKFFSVLIITVICQGLALGSLDTGGNVLLLNLFGKNSDAQMQGLHAMFGLGAFVSPLLVSPFLTTPSQDNLYSNTTNGTRNGTLDMKNSTVNSTHGPGSIDHSALRYPYIISMLFFVIPIITFIAAGFKDHSQNPPRDKQWETVSGSDQRAYKGFTLVLVFVFLLFYVGLEVAIGGLIFSFSFTHGILKSKSSAAYLTSTFWGSFCAGRFLSIPLSMYVRAYRILVMDLLGCIIGASILVFVSTSVQAWLWIGTSLLGLCMAAVFPSTMSWAETFMHISGRTASVLVVGASLGEMTIPLAIGTLMQRNGADVFLEAIFVIILLAIIVFIIASVLAKRQLKLQTDGFHFHYHKGEEQSNHSIFSKPKGDEVIQLLEDSSEIFSVDN